MCFSSLLHTTMGYTRHLQCRTGLRWNTDVQVHTSFLGHILFIIHDSSIKIMKPDINGQRWLSLIDELALWPGWWQLRCTDAPIERSPPTETFYPWPYHHILLTGSHEVYCIFDSTDSMHRISCSVHHTSSRVCAFHAPKASGCSCGRIDLHGEDSYKTCSSEA